MLRSLFFLLLTAKLLAAAPFQFDLSSEAAYLINSETGHCLFQKNGEKVLYPASTTKIATALFALKKMRSLEEKVVAKKEALASISPLAKKQSKYRAPSYWLETDGNHIGIKVGEEFKLKELLSAMLINSANDAANVVAEHIGGTIPHFLEEMNLYLKELGCQKTHFCNPTGFHHPEHVSCAKEMALIAREAMKIPFFRETVAKKSYTLPATNLSPERPLLQTNLLLRKGSHFYPHAIGIKTGTTQIGGKALIAAAKNPERALIAVILANFSAQERYDDVIKLFNGAFHEKKVEHTLVKKSTLFSKKVKGGKKAMRCTLLQDLQYATFASEPLTVKAHVEWHIPPLPIERGMVVGRAKVIDQQGRLLNTLPLYATEKVSMTLLYKMQLFIVEKKKESLFAIGALCLFLCVVSYIRRRKKRRGAPSLF